MKILSFHHLFLRKFAFLFMSIFVVTVYAAPPSYTSGHTAAQLAAKIEGPGITITNPVLTRGLSTQNSIFTNGIQAGLAIEEGITLATMQPDHIYRDNSSANISDSMGGTGNGTDPDLLLIDANARYDTVVFEFDVTLDESTRLLLVNYQFASEEYNEYVGSRFNDAFGFFVTSLNTQNDFAGATYNIARVVNPNVFTTINNLATFPPVTVNNVNNGTIGANQDGTAWLNTNAQYFIDNNGDPNNPGPGTIEVEFDGVTVGLNATLDNLTPGGTYHFKMALADVGDGAWDTGVFINSINGVKAPKICYDYSYKQNTRYFTSEYNSSVGPQLEGDVVPHDPISVSVSIQNQEESEIVASGVRFTVLDINDSQATYSSNSVYVTNTNSLLATHIPDNTLGMTNTPTEITDIPALDIGNMDFFFVSYDLDPSVNHIEMDFNWKIDYNLTLVLSPTQSVFIPITAIIDQDTDLCSGGAEAYDATWGIYNVEDTTLAGTGKYNLYTQVAGRPFQMNLVSYDPSDLTTLSNKTAFVAIEMIDANAYQTVSTSCIQPDSAITDRIWTQLADQSNIPIDINQAVLDQLIPDVASFFDEARENVSFRVSYLLDENGTSPIAYTQLGPDSFDMTGFPDLQGRECSVDPRTGAAKLVKKPTNTQLTDQANVACGNIGNGGVSAQTLRNCLECLYDSNVAYVCSRDNFAIRPESFSIEISDNAQSDNENNLRTILPNNGVIPTNVAAGYDYRYDINATSHIDSNPVTGFTLPFSPTISQAVSSPTHFTYFWDPANSGAVLATCNDTFDKYPSAYIKNGAAVNYQNRADNVGLYELQMRDSAWTKVDQNPDHHQNDTNSFNAYDCQLNKSNVPAVANTIGDGANGTQTVGCTISSKHTNLDDASLVYRDFNVSVHPYKFDISKIRFQKGIMARNLDYNTTTIYDFNLSTGEHNTTYSEDNLSESSDINLTNAFIYQNSLNGVNDDVNMSIRYVGQISAQGADGNITTNFVRDCFAQNINLDVLTSNLNNPNFPAYSYRLREWGNLAGTQGAVILNDTIRGDSDDVIPRATDLTGMITLPQANFEPLMSGAVEIELNLNFDRLVNVAMNPINLTYNDFNVSCTTKANCQSRANMELTHDVNGTYTITNPAYVPLNVLHVYARQHVPRHRSTTPAAIVPIYYEFYCDSSLGALPAPCNIGTYNVLPSVANPISPVGRLSPDAVRWYAQVQHLTSIDGNTTAIQTRGGFEDGAFGPNTLVNMDVDFPTASQINFLYNGSRGYPYKVTIETITPDWLLYNRYDGSPTVNVPGGLNVNSFELEFSQVGVQAGTDNSNVHMNSNGAAGTNRRIQW